MTALAQGTAGLALVMVFVLLGTQQAKVAAMLLLAQSLIVAITAMAQHQPLIAAATIVVDVVGATLVLRQAQLGGPVAPPALGIKRGILAGAALAVLSLSCGVLWLPLSIVLLSILLAATRPHPRLRLIALVSLQNGLSIAACLDRPLPLPALASFFLAVPLACTLLPPPRLARWRLLIPAWIGRRTGWMQLVLCLGLLAGSVVIPLDPIGAVFAPLIAAWGVAEARVMLHRTGLSVVARGATFKRLLFMLLAIGWDRPIIAWLCVVVALGASLYPAARRQPERMLLASCAAGLALFGLLTLPAAPPTLSYGTLFLGYATVAAVVPDLAVVVVVLVLRLTLKGHLPPVAGSILMGVALAGLAVCVLLLRHGRHRATVVPLAQASLAATVLGLDLPQARFAALVLMILLILSRAAARLAAGRHGVASAVALGGLGGIPPFGVFPGLVLVLLAFGSLQPWLLVPVGAALMVIAAASLPARRPDWTRIGMPSLAWLPLLLTLGFGYFAPAELTRWLQAAIAGAP
jgi:hypothetical protein